MSKPFATIIVPVLREREKINECVMSLARQTYPQNRTAIIVVIDGRGDGRIKDDLDALRIKNLTVVQNRRFGSAAARNLAVSLTDKRTRYFAFTDADCIASKTWLATLISSIEELPGRVGCVGGTNLTPKSDPAIAQVVGCLEQTLLGGGGSPQGSVMPRRMVVASIPNCNALYRAEWWRKNKQDERLIVGQDGEFNYRLAKQGCRFVVVPGAIVWHHRPSRISSHIRRMYKYGFATTSIFKKHPGILGVRWYALPPVLLLIGSIALALLGLVFPQAWFILAVSLGLYAALVMLTTLQVAVRCGRPSSILILLLLPCQHVAYGLGFLFGLL